MELPQQLTTDLKIVQHQMKLEIQTHQIMRIKQANDPNNFKHDDLREVEKRISILGEKQNQLMRWLRRILTTIPSNSALMAKTIASSLGITVNGTHPSPGTQTNNIIINNKRSSILKNNNNRNIHSHLKDRIKGLKTVSTNEKKRPDELSHQLLFNTESKDKIRERGRKLTPQKVPENCSSRSKIAKQQQNSTARNKQTSPDPNAYLCEPLTVEKEKFLSAVGLVTREVLKELQNRRVERKRRSTANHTQFVYGTNWEISAKKRKKSNYLTSTAKQHVTRQAARTQPPRSEVPVALSKQNPIVSIFKTPLPISNQSQNETTDAIITSTSSLKTVTRCQPLASNDDDDDDCNDDDEEPECIDLPDTPPLVVYETKPADPCFVCQKTDGSTIACSCSIHYHHACAEIVENCVGCGVKLKSNIEDRRAEKHHLQDMNSQLNCEKEELEIRAAELSVTLATQVERKKNLLSMEDDVRKKIQRIHEFVAIMKNSQSVPLS